MKPLFTELEFLEAKSNNKLMCQCYQCNNTFFLTKHQIQKVLNINETRVGKFCSKKCQSESQNKKQIITCINCNNEFKKLPNQIKKTKNHFCSRSCSVTYHNTHKTMGNCRSKLEKYLEIELIKLYPNLEILFNNKDMINSELDIYIPEHKLAFELNGIFHYEPIFGKEKLQQIQNNDNRKFQACLEQEIELCIIDTSQQKYFKKQSSEKFLTIIANIINNKSS
jgi:predicted XRE-type DNA-binding protein